MAQRQIPPERKAIFYIGMTVGVVGLLCFASTFVSAIFSFGDFSNFKERVHSMGIGAIVGMGLMGAGVFLTIVGRMGLAGSGVKLDPEQARRDVEPLARMTGGIVKDAMDEAGIKLGGSQSNEELPFDERLRRLQKLRDDGLVSDEEYESTKKKILESA